jgi:predicted RNA binding protein YcfA (HicA-like mRNA interferase family)
MAAKRLKDQQVRRALASTGFVHVRATKSAHEIYRGPNGYQPIVVSFGHSKGE